MFSSKFIRTITLSVATLVAAPSIAPSIMAPTAAHAGKKNKQNRNKVKKAIKRKIARKLDKRRDQKAVKSIKRTRLVLRAALRSVKKNEGDKGQLAGALLHQRAAVIALKKDHPRAALWLTRKARVQARDIIRENRAEMPAGGRDHIGEFVRADAREAPRFIELARRLAKREISPEVKEAIGKTRALVVEAAKAAKTGGKEKAQLRKAMVQQKAARKAAKRGKDKVALHLTGQARETARAVLEANGGATETTLDNAELATADATGSEEFTAAAESTVATDIEPADVEDAADDEIDEEIDADVDEDDDDDELATADDTDA